MNKKVVVICVEVLRAYIVVLSIVVMIVACVSCVLSVLPLGG